MSELDKFRKMLARGELKEAAEWIKESPSVAFGSEGELRRILYLLSDSILDGKSRPGQFVGQRHFSYEEHDFETRTTPFTVMRRMSLAEWERQIYLAVMARTDVNGRVKRGAYKEVSDIFFKAAFDGGDENPKGCTAANVKRIYEKHSPKS